MNILLTGASGTIGTELLFRLAINNFANCNIYTTFKKGFIEHHFGFEKHNIRFHSILCDIATTSNLNSLISISQPDIIVHLAAKSSPRLDSPQSVLDTNIRGTFNLLEACKQSKPEKPIDFVFASSVLVYGGNAPYQQDNMYYESDKLYPETIYGISKVTCEQMIRLYAKDHVIRPRILRLCGIAAKNMHHGRMAEVLSGQREFTLYGKPPGSKLPYLNIKNAVSAIISAIQSNRPEVLCNICPSDSISLSTLYDVMSDIVKEKIEVKWSDNGATDSMITCHTEKASYELNWKAPECSMNEIYEALQ